MSYAIKIVCLMAIALTAFGCGSMAEPRPGRAQAETLATDDEGRLRTPGDQKWMDLVAVSSDNPDLRPLLAKSIQKNFSVRIVAVPQSHVLVRLFSCSDRRAIKLCASVQYAGAVVGRKEFSSLQKEAPDDRQSSQMLEHLFFLDPQTQDQFLDFVQTQFDTLQTKGAK